MFWNNKNNKIKELIIKNKELREKLRKKEESYNAAHSARSKLTARINTALYYIKNIPKESVKIKRSDIDKLNTILIGRK